MKQKDAPVPNSDRQMSLMFEPRRMDGMNEEERVKAGIMLAQVLMLAAGLIVEELDDGQR